MEVVRKLFRRTPLSCRSSASATNRALFIMPTAFSKKKTLFTSKLDLNLRKKLIKCYIWSMALYGAETWTLRAADQK